jgi:alginate O-acetyltransferase complex protein AlgI
MATATAVARNLEPSQVEPQLEHWKPDVLRFAMLVIPLALLLVTFKAYTLEQPAFFTLACLVFGGFAVSYWLPVRYKESFQIAPPLVASLLIAAGLLMFGIVRSEGIGFRWRVGALLAILAICAYGRTIKGHHAWDAFWPVLGAVFMFRMIIYLYDVKHQPGPARLKDFLSYFFLLPNYYFLFFPVVDFKTFRRSYLQRDIHPVAQQGIWWIFRGTTHLLLYRVIYQLQARWAPPAVPVHLAVALKVVSCYLLYLRISGQFHIIAGMLCLFGYDMPETNHRYLLAHSVNDLWRRINIYWKDFMVKMVYFPAYFKLRRKGALRAELLSTVLVVVATYTLHVYQFFWLKGQFRLSVTDTLFWLILGSVMVLNVWIESRNRQKSRRTGWGARLQNAVQIVATFAFIALLWSMWSSDSLTDWFDFLRTGSV